MILITGGMGFIGLHTARRLVDRGERLVLTQFRRRREPAFLSEEFGRSVAVEQLDVVDKEALEALVRRHRVDSIIHLAVPGLGALDAAAEYRTNTEALLNVLEVARDIGGRVTIASSVAVYSGCDDGPFVEDRPLPVTSASSTEAYKKAEEILGLHLSGPLDIDSRYLRIAQIYGPLYHSMRNLPSRVAHAAARGAALELHDAERASSAAHRSADLCYVTDCAEGIALAHTSDRLNHRVYNLGAGQGVAPADVIDAARAAAPDAGLPHEGAGTADHQQYMSIDRLREDTGYSPAFDIGRGMAAYIDWLRSNDL
ncbi:NAD-dependent epimerase/dehydratase family protein [Egicoccus halophilus]|uniref:NAD-dependent epimerase n=1 Tax=Egicoccus halophilus TaxID=1670830 RepID=A0A8J3A9H3_9ACTN|nr:NAD(P)-dependent oxidoreductase [Egicoccus halophilus]GGI07530.1 NAD-dependent epimerase [Egicoccus halophilus]